MSWTLAFAGACALAAGYAFARVGSDLRKRALDREDDRRALSGFSAWWLGVGGWSGAMAAMSFASLAPEPPILLVTLLRMASLGFLSAGMVGLLTHAIYLRTGRDLGALIAVAYAALTAAVWAFILWSRPDHLVVTEWTVEIGASRPAAGLTWLFVLAYLIPPLVAGGGYLALVPRAPSREQRVRLRVVGAGLLVWVGSHLLARVTDAAAWQLTTRVGLGFAVALAVWIAYLPPAPAEPPEWLDERLRALI